MSTTNPAERENVQRCTEEFVESLKRTPQVMRFNEAMRRFEADQEVQSLMATLRRFQQEQQNGQLLEQELQDVRNAQLRIRDHGVVREFLAARDAVGDFLKGTNAAISEVLGLDFGQTAGPAGGGC